MPKQYKADSIIENKTEGYEVGKKIDENVIDICV